MSAAWTTVRVFISSTFRDMQAERDHLVTVVFPELRERCERLGLEFFDVDLRWGVPEKTVNKETQDLEEANSWEYCRQWIDRVDPFFICILGQRYGWEPPPEKLKNPDEAERQRCEPRSITDMEVHYAVLEQPKQKRLSYFYLRETTAPDTESDFVDPELEKREKLEQLKSRIRKGGRPVFDYGCSWTGDHFTKLDIFGKAVLEQLWSAILRDERYVKKEVWGKVLGHAPESDPLYADEGTLLLEHFWKLLADEAKPTTDDPLKQEREEMECFAELRLRWFQGRTAELKNLTDFILAPAEENQSRLALVAALPGQGKSALMAKLQSSLIAHSSSLFLISHFVGATAKSSSSYNLVRRLLDELDESGIPFPERSTPEGQAKEEPKLDFQSLCQRLWDRLGDYDGEPRIIILLDALNQFDDGHELGWLPYRLGPGVRVVVSCIEETPAESENPQRGIQSEATQSAGSLNLREKLNSETNPAQKVLAALDSRHPKPKRIPLGSLTAEDIRTIVTSYLEEYCKELDPSHVDAICDETKLPQARNPLYLLVMLAELRTLGGNDMNQHVPALIAELGTRHPNTVSLFHWVLERLEKAEGFGEQAVRWWCLYLALGRVGMSSRELSDLLVRKLGPDSAATAQRIERALRRYLQRRGEQWDFFHGQLREALMERYGGEQRVVQGHNEIAGYFQALADPVGDKTWKGESHRAFSETAPHLIGGERWDGVCDYLTDYRCLDRRIRAGHIFEVVKDHAAVIASLPELADEARREKERVSVCAEYGAALIAYSRDCAAGKKTSLPQPPATANTMAQDFAEERSARGARLKAIANFTAQNATLLSAYPAYFLSLTANTAADGSLTEAETVANASCRPWLHRSLRPPAPSLKPQCLQTLRGHMESVTSVSVTPDGRRVVSASRDTLRIWDLDTGQCLQTLQGHTESVTSVSVTPDGRHAVSASRDTLRIWDLDTGQCLQTLQGHTSYVKSVSMTPDGRRAISGSWDNTVRLWDLDSGQCLQTLQRHTHWVESVSVTPDGRRAISGSYDNTVRLWDLDSGQCLQTLQGHTRWVESVSVTPDGRRAVSASGDTLRLWDLDTGQCLLTLQGHTSSVLSVSVTPDGRRAVSASSDNTLRLWDLDGGQRLQTLQGHTGGVTSASVTPDGRCAVSASDDNTLRLWDLDSGQCLQTLQGHTGVVTSVSVTPNGRRAVFASGDTVRLWDLDSGQCLQTLQGHTGVVTSVSVTPDGRRAISVSWENTLRLWDLDGGQCMQTLRGHTNLVTCVSVTPDGRRAISASWDNTLRLWDLDSGQCLQTLQVHTDLVRSVSVTPDGRRAVSASNDNTLRLWHLDSSQCLLTLQGHTDVVTCVGVTPDGRRAVSGSWDSTLRLWDLDSGQCLAVYHAGASVGCVAVFPKDDRIVCGTADGQMHFLTMRNFPPSA